MSDSDPEKITIVEGPPPSFEAAADPWVHALSEGPLLRHTARCVLRTFNGPALVERCRHAWSESRDVLLDYRDEGGLRKEALILAARHNELPEGQVLQLWLQLDALPEAALDDSDPDFDSDADGPF